MACRLRRSHSCSPRPLSRPPAQVVGGGDTAAEEALVLARTSSAVTLVHRRERLRASHALASRVLSHPKITVVFRTVVERFEGAGGALRSVWLRSTNDDGGGGRTWKLDVAAAFVAIGHAPNTQLLHGSALKLTATGYVDMSHAGRSTATSADGVFAAGRVQLERSSSGGSAGLSRC